MGIGQNQQHCGLGMFRTHTPGPKSCGKTVTRQYSGHRRQLQLAGAVTFCLNVSVVNTIVDRPERHHKFVAYIINDIYIYI